MPRAKSLAGRVAFITGGAGGIGSAIAERLMKEGASVVLADIDEASLETTVANFGKTFGKDNVRGVVMDVTREELVIQAMDDAVKAFGGVDIVVITPGSPFAANVEDTTLLPVEQEHVDHATGYFLVGREGTA